MSSSKSAMPNTPAAIYMLVFDFGLTLYIGVAVGQAITKSANGVTTLSD